MPGRAEPAARVFNVRGDKVKEEPCTSSSRGQVFLPMEERGGCEKIPHQCSLREVDRY